MEDLLKSLPPVLRANPNSPELNEAAAVAAWKHAVGEGLKLHTIAKSLEGKTLIVAVRDPIWQNQLDLMKSHLIFRVNSILGLPLVSNIELLIEPKSFATKTAERKVEDPTDNEIPLELWSAASKIDDKQLRQKFLKAATASLKRTET